MKLKIRRAWSVDIKDIHALHSAQADEYIWPRTEAEFEELANDGCLYVAFEFEETSGKDSLVGVCYVMAGFELDDESTCRWEFGGVYVVERLRGSGLGSALGRVAIAAHCVTDMMARDERLISHVHEFNVAPRGMLTKQLGFLQNGEEIPPPEIAPENMKRNKCGQVIGHLFVFNRKALSDFADWFEQFSGKIKGRNGDTETKIHLKVYEADPAGFIDALRELSRGS